MNLTERPQKTVIRFERVSVTVWESLCLHIFNNIDRDRFLEAIQIDYSRVRLPVGKEGGITE